MLRVGILAAAMLCACPAFAGEDADNLNGRVAVLVRTTAGGEALVDGARHAYGEVTVIDAEAVSAAMLRDGESLLTERRMKGIRASVAADRLLVIELHVTQAGLRLLQLRAFDATGKSHRRNVEVTDATMLERFRRMLEDLPPALPRKKTFAEHARFATTDDDVFFDVNVFGGRKMMSDSDWGALATQNEVGLLGTFGPTRWPVHLALEGYGARSFDGGNSSTTITEFSGGLRRVFAFGPVRPFVGAGAGYTLAAYSQRGLETKTDRGTVIWAGAGAAFRVRSYGNVGVQVRYSTADVTLGSRTVDAGGVHLGVTVGMGSARPRPKR